MSKIENKNENMLIYDEEWPAQKIIFMRRVGEYGLENQKLMEQFKSWVSGKELFHDDAVILGIARDDAKAVPPEQCRYDVCLLVDNPDEYIDEAVESGELSSGKYAVIRVPHTPEGVKKAWREGLSLLAQSYEFDLSRPIMERYVKKLVDNHFCELCVPVL